MSDNWQNRAANMRCDTCTSFVLKSSADGVGRLGRCRRHAPTMSGFPVVFPADWCGDHKLDENKIAVQVVHVMAKASDAPARPSVVPEFVTVPPHVDSDDACTFYGAGRDGVDFHDVRTVRPVLEQDARRFYNAGRDGSALVFNS